MEFGKKNGRIKFICLFFLLFQSDAEQTNLTHNGYRYVLNKVVKGTKYWRCHNRKCKGCAIMKESLIIESKDHDHPPNKEMSEVRVCKSLFLLATYDPSNILYIMNLV